MKKLLSDFLNLFTPDNKIEVYFWWIIIPIILLLTLAIAYSIYFALKERNKELSKKDLARKKLTSEIRSFKLFWLTPSLSLATAVVVAIVGWRSGFFDTNLKLIEIKTIKLQIEEDSLKSRKLKLQKDLIILDYKYDSLYDKLDSIIKSNLYLTSRYNGAVNTIKNRDSIIAIQKRDLIKWKETNQPSLDLKNEVLLFVKDLYNLINLKTIYPEANFDGPVCDLMFNQFSNPITYIYNVNYADKALSYRTRIDDKLGNDLDKVMQELSIYMNSPFTIVNIMYVAHDLESMAKKINK